MKYCGYCGTEIPSTMHYCPHCGKEQGDKEEKWEGKNLNRLSGKWNKKKMIAAAILLVTILMLTVGFYIFLRPFSENTIRINRAVQSVVMLSCYNMKDELIASGSGFVAIEDDYVITNCHVIDYCTRIQVLTEQDITYDVVDVVAYNKDIDIAILRLEKNTGLPILPIGNSEEIKKGEKITAIGSPMGIKNTVSTGILSGRLLNQDSGVDELQFTAPISSGSSGGALFDESGCVIGVTYASISEGQNLNLAIPIEKVMEIYLEREMPISLSQFVESVHPGYEYYTQSQFVEFDELLSEPDKYNGKLITVPGYAVETTEEVHAANGKIINRVFLIPTEEFKRWEEEPVYTGKGMNLEGYFLYWFFSPFEDSCMIKCDDTSLTVDVNNFDETYCVVTGIFEYSEAEPECRIASFKMLYIGPIE